MSGWVGGWDWWWRDHESFLIFFLLIFFLPFSFCALSCRYVEPTLLASVCEPDDISVSLVLSQDYKKQTKQSKNPSHALSCSVLVEEMTKVSEQGRRGGVAKGDQRTWPQSACRVNYQNFTNGRRPQLVSGRYRVHPSANLHLSLPHACPSI